MNTITKQQPQRVETMDPETGELTLLETASENEAGALMVMGEVNAQVATARRYPRRRAIDIARNIEGLATMTEEVAEECMYSLPRGGKTIEGPSIRFAEIVQQQWGNNRVEAAIGNIDRVNKRIQAVGMYHDLETNSATRVTMWQRISGSDKTGGKIYNDDMIQVAGVAAASKARRNAILAGVPRAVWHGAYQKVRQVIMGDIKTLANRRAAAITEFQRFGITAEALFGLLEGVKDENDITLEHLVTLRGTLSGLKSGEVTVEQLFRQNQPAQPKDVSETQQTTKSTLDQFGAGGQSDVTVTGTITATGAKGPSTVEGQPSNATQSAGPAVTAGKDSAADVTKPPEESGDGANEGSAEVASSGGAEKKAGPTQSESANQGETSQTVQEEDPDPKAQGRSARAEAIKVAKGKGEEARQHGTRRSAVPGDYRKDKELADAWLAGWDGPLGTN